MPLESSDLSRILQALAFAAHKHRNQRRKDHRTSPYINHPIALADTLVNEGGIADPTVICAALLHDTLEDTETTVAELEQHFGAAVAAIVVEVSDDKTEPKAERKRLQIEHAPHLSDAAKLVKLVDKISNLRDILEHPPADWTDQRKREYFDWAARVVDGLRGIHPELEAVFDALYRRAPLAA